MHKEGLYISRKRIRDKWKERKGGVCKIKTGRKSWVEDLYMSKTGKSIKWMTEKERKWIILDLLQGWLVLQHSLGLSRIICSLLIELQHASVTFLILISKQTQKTL